MCLDLVKVEAEVDLIQYLVKHGAKVNLQTVRKEVDSKRPLELSNGYCLRTLYPDFASSKALRKILKQLSVQNYMDTVRDVRMPYKPKFWVFGLEIQGREVYVKLRRIQQAPNSKGTIFVMSVHFSDRPFANSNFPFREHQNLKQAS